MTHTLKFAALAAALFLLQSCGKAPEPAEQAAAPEAPASAEPAAQPEPTPGPQPHVVEIRAVGKTFEGPSEIPSGWITFRFVNASSMVHFGIIDVPPEGVTIEMLSEDVMTPFQDAMDAMNAGDEEAANAAFGRIPGWISELGRNGGPGMLSPGRIGEATIWMEPGHYVMECYVKSDGVFHTTSPGPGQIGMMLDLSVTDEESGAPEPEAGATLTVRNTGYELTGDLAPGRNTIRVDFVEQQALPSFVGNDVHLLRVDNAESIARADAWMDWRTPDGLEDPAPVTFLGGVNDLPAGSHGYFTVDLDPGDYAFIAEMPGPQAAGFTLRFSVTGE